MDWPADREGQGGQAAIRRPPVDFGPALIALVHAVLSPRRAITDEGRAAGGTVRSSFR
jgi:hypothetical protein